MAIPSLGPRDRLQRLVDLGGKTMRYWWLIAVFAVGGGALSLAFALTRAHNYQSWATLFYQERIQSSLLSNREEVVQRNIADRYRELLFARAELAPIVADPELNPFGDVDDPELAIDKLRNQIHFEARGVNAFRIVYTDTDPDRARAVTERLTKLLQDRDEALRNDQAQATVSFVTTQKEEAAADLRKREQALAEFLAKHPEFVQDPNTQGEGAAVRAIRNKPAQTGNPRLYALERQRERIQARLDAPPDAPAIRVVVPPSPEKIAAEAVVTEAQRELSAANRELEEALAKYTDKHPAVVNAKDRVEAAQQRLRHAQAAVPPDVEAPVLPATPADRDKLQKQLGELEGLIAAEQKHSPTKGETASADASTNWVVQLETQHADLRRAVNEERERVQSLADSVFRAQMDASTKLAEAGGRLTVVDAAFKPVQPTGPGKTIFLLAGMLVFLSLGGGLAVGLAAIDDRLYRGADIDQAGLAVLAVIPPGPRGRERRARERAHAKDRKKRARKTKVKAVA
ncbi:MAG TPA: hypothetical protein VMJ10_12340 [Kofleriaceae bacterium]|nr:hypothetical protein [Kofleriaceae bacterium]